MFVLRILLIVLTLLSCAPALNSPSNSGVDGFYYRKDRGFGHFITKQEIARLNPPSTLDLLVRVPGVSQHPSGRLRMRGGQESCAVQIYMDNMRITRPGFDINVNEYVSPADLEGVEIYRGNPPAEFTNLNSSCGTVVLWTKRG